MLRFAQHDSIVNKLSKGVTLSEAKDLYGFSFYGGPDSGRIDDMGSKAASPLLSPSSR
jgi:hypothetical protein